MSRTPENPEIPPISDMGDMSTPYQKTPPPFDQPEYVKEFNVGLTRARSNRLFIAPLGTEEEIGVRGVAPRFVDRSPGLEYISLSDLVGTIDTPAEMERRSSLGASRYEMRGGLVGGSGYNISQPLVNSYYLPGVQHTPPPAHELVHAHREWADARISSLAYQMAGRALRLTVMLLEPPDPIEDVIALADLRLAQARGVLARINLLDADRRIDEIGVAGLLSDTSAAERIELSAARRNATAQLADASAQEATLLPLAVSAHTRIIIDDIRHDSWVQTPTFPNALLT